MKKTSLLPLVQNRFRLAALLAVGMLSNGLTTQAQELQVLKLHGVWSKPPVSYFIGNSDGNSLEVSDKWILAGTPSADEQATNQGAVQVFNAVTGACTRKLLPPPPVAANQRFGNSCALAGNLAFIQAKADLGPARVYVYDLASGKKLRELTHPAVLDTHYFGDSMAVWGDKVLVGASGTDNDRGAVYVFSVSTGAFITKIQPADTVSADYFGSSVAVDGNFAVISAPYSAGGKGCAYLYERRSMEVVKKFAATGAVAGDNVGYRVAISGTKVLLTSFLGNGRVIVFDILTSSEKVLIASDDAQGGLGSALTAHAGIAIVGSSEGKAYVFDLLSSSTTELRTISPPDTAGYFSRNGVKLYEGTAVISGESDDTLANGSGSVYLMRTVTRPLTLTKVAARADFAPGAADTTFNVLGDALINPGGAIAFTSTLAGPGSNKGKDNGLWSTLIPDVPGYPPGLNLVLKSRDQVLGTTVASVGSLRINRPQMCLYVAKRVPPSGPIIMKDNGEVTERLYQNPFATLDLNYPTLVQSHIIDRAAFSVTLKTGINGVNATNDSGLVLLKPSEPSQANVLDRVREGEAAGTTGLTYGQFTGRVALYYAHELYTTAVAGAPAANQALFRKRYAEAEELVAQKGQPAPAAGGASFAAFIGETTEDIPYDLFRATLGAPATAATNEGLWARNGSNPAFLVMRKGDILPGTNGLKIASFIQYWESFRQTLALVKLSGPGVTAASDQALLLYQNTDNVAGSVLMLMREGDIAPGCAPATIGVINRVEVDSFYGQYLVLATLAGAPAGANQCLFRGASYVTTSIAVDQYRRLPVAVLRKGQLFNGRPARIKSISLPAGNVTAGGAGSTGIGSAMQLGNSADTPGPVVLTVEFENGLRQVMKGIP